MWRCGCHGWREGIALRVVWLIASAALACWGCGSWDTYRVRRGDTLSSISARFGVSVAELAKANRLSDPNCILEGQELRIPRKRGGRAPVYASQTGLWVSRDARWARRVVSRWQGRLQWPVPNGELSSGYGPRSGAFHSGVDIAASLGSAVLAAADGEVVFSGQLRGYGLTVILSHDAGLATLYAHNQKNLVREGQRVKQGQVIARVGDSGRTTGPNLHFEVRYSNVPFDPLLLLPRGALAEPRHTDAWGG